MSSAQDQRFRRLCDDLDAVAARPMPDGALALTGRDKSGRLAAAELVDPAGQPLDLAETIRRLGAIRQAALQTAEAATDHLIEHLALATLENPDAVNLSDVHATTGVARQTLYNRLKALELSKALPKPGRKRRRAKSSTNGAPPAATGAGASSTTGKAKPSKAA